VIDRNTGAGFDYPSSSSIILRRIESAVREGLTEVKEKLSSNAGPSPTITQKLRDLQELRKDGVITEADFEKKKQLLLIFKIRNKKIRQNLKQRFSVLS
jgi:hypothetical protein